MRKQHFSQSQLGEFLKCEQRYAFKYGLGMKKPPSPPLTMGQAFHYGTGVDYAQKIDTDKNLDPKEVADIAVSELEERAEETEWRPDATKGDSTDRVAAATVRFSKKISKAVHPVDVEQNSRVEFDLDGEPAIVDSWIDVVEADGTLIDSKTANRQWSKTRPATELQPIIYTMQTPGTSLFVFNVAPLDGGEPKRFEREISETDKAGARALTFYAARRMKGLKADPEKALPTGFGKGPAAWWCTKRYCDYADDCRRVWKLPIPE